VLAKLKLVSLILAAAHAAWDAEQAAAKQPGATKLSDALAAVTAAAQSILPTEFSAATASALQSTLTLLINAVVAVANTFGLFTHKATPTTQPAATK
jgi:hypothetical protein